MKENKNNGPGSAASRERAITAFYIVLNRAILSAAKCPKEYSIRLSNYSSQQ